MKKLLQGLEATAGIAFVIAILGATIFGVHHAGSKHDTGIIALMVPPYAWYRAVEAIGWHDDFAGIDWNERLAADTKILMALLGSDSSDPATVFQIEKSKEYFAGQIAEYPQEKQDHLKRIAILFISFQQSLARDIINYTRQVYDDKDNLGVTFAASEETSRLEKQLSAFTDELDNAHVALEVMTSQIAKSIKEGRHNLEYTEMETVAAASIDRSHKHTASIYRALFGEELPESPALLATQQADMVNTVAP
jgi:hypothetical protein